MQPQHLLDSPKLLGFTSLVVVDLKREIDQTRGGTGDDPLEREAMALREALQSARDDEENEIIDYAISERTDRLLGRPVNHPSTSTSAVSRATVSG